MLNSDTFAKVADSLVSFWRFDLHGTTFEVLVPPGYGQGITARPWTFPPGREFRGGQGPRRKVSMALVFPPTPRFCVSGKAGYTIAGKTCLYVGDGGYSIFVDGDSGHIIVEVESGSAESMGRSNLPRFERLVREGLIEWFRLNGSYSVHASAVTDGEFGILLVGESGSGKSTLAASFVSEGWSLLNDDLVLLEADQDGVFLKSLPGPIRLTRESRALLPELAEQSGAGHWASSDDAAGKRSFYPGEVSGGASATFSKVGAVVGLSPGTAGELTIRPSSSRKALGWLLDGAGRGNEAEHGSERLETFTKIVSSATCLECRRGASRKLTAADLLRHIRKGTS